MSNLLSGLPPEAQTELRTLLSEKASDLFAICDQEDKGFVTKRDMQRMRAELPLDPDQLEAVFDTLDNDGNGYLTLEEFTEGFGEYLGIEAENKVEDEVEEETIEEVDIGRNGDMVAEMDEEDEFNMMLSELGILGLVEDDSSLRDMWLNLKTENDPALVANFEEFLGKLSRDLHKKTTEQENFENAIRNRSAVQEENLQRLYEEMEQQIGAERKKIREEEERREMKMREELESTLRMKDDQLNDAMTRMRTLQEQLDEAKKAVPDFKSENALLSKERDTLQHELERQKILQKELQEHMESLRVQTQSERRERAKAALKVSENIAQEREGLVQQLDFMKAINAKMLDDRDQQEVQVRDQRDVEDDMAGLDKELMAAQGNSEETMSPLTEEKSETEMPNLSRFLAPPSQPEVANSSECEYDDDYFENSPSVNEKSQTGNSTTSSLLLRHHPVFQPKFKRFNSQQYPPNENSFTTEPPMSLQEELACLDSGRGSGGSLAAIQPNSSRSSLEDADTGTGNRRRRHSRRNRPGNDANFTSSLLILHDAQRRKMGKQNSGGNLHESLNSSMGPASYEDSELTSFNASDIGPSASTLAKSHSMGQQASVEIIQPERVFKVIFIGDSCVGKSSIIKRFCTGVFHPGLKSTIGVDFHTKSVQVEGESVCLQCWDTAGQERYRAITHQYFRKSDAVIVVYDITSEKTFLNAREWLDNAVDGAGEQASLLLLGNKMDLAQDDLLR